MEKNDINCSYSMMSFFGFRTRYSIAIRFHWSSETREKSCSSSFLWLSNKRSKDGGHKFACWGLFVPSRIVGIFQVVAGGRFGHLFPGLCPHFTNLYLLGITAALDILSRLEGKRIIHTYIQIMFWTNGTANSYHHLNIDGQERYVNICEKPNI